MFSKHRLCEFLVKAKRATYAAGDSAVETRNEDHSKTLVFEEGDWKYHDNYFGGEPYGGREVVFYKKKPVYMMVYFGAVADSVSDIKKVYGILMEALTLIPNDKPYRGPLVHTSGDFLYKNSSTGAVGDFHGKEVILENGVEIYSANYIGGLVDVRKEEELMSISE